MTEELKLRRIRANEAALLFGLLSDESIAPYVFGAAEGRTDAVIRFLTNEQNICLVCENEEHRALGAFMIFWSEPGVYVVHTAALPEVRGKAYVRAAREALKTMFLCSPDCMELYTRVPEANKAALGLTRLFPWRREFTLSQGWEGKPCWMYALRWYDWVWSPLGAELEELGAWLHTRFDEEFVGKEREEHPDDSAHNRMAGAAAEMVFNGCVPKALVLYNRWANLTGYDKISIVVQQPLVLACRDSLFQVNFEKRDFTLLDSKLSDILPQYRELMSGAAANESAA